MGAEKPNKTSRTRRAGLYLPIHSVRKQLKAKLGPKRSFEKGVEVIYAGATEHLIQRLLIASAERIKKGNYIDAIHLHAVMNDKEAEVAGVFPQHATGLY